MLDKLDLKNKKIAIFGGAGFIGHHLALKLASMGAEPHVIDGLQVNSIGYYTSGYSENPNAGRYIEFINERLRLLREARVNLHVIDARDYRSQSYALEH